MILSIEPESVERFRSTLSGHLGLAFDDTHLGLLRDALHLQVQRTGLSVDGYLRRLQSSNSAQELSEVAAQITVGETYFFRNMEQFRALQSVVLAQPQPHWAERGLRLLSAGCASGEEAYSLAMLAREAFPGPGLYPQVHIRAVDINPRSLERARRARYSQWSLRETNPATRSRWFECHGNEYRLSAELQNSVAFTCANLTQRDHAIFPEREYDAIFCRNVLMYLTGDAMRAVVGQLARALVPGGYLFLGHAETLRNISHDFHLCHSHGSFYYRLKDPAETQAEVQHLEANGARPQHIPAGNGAAWVDLIGEATERVRRLSTRASDSEPVAMEAGPDLSLPLEYLRKEQFSQALDAVRTLEDAHQGAPEVLVLEAVLLVHRGELEPAESVCSRLLQADDLNAGAHYVLALCREGQGDPAGALHHNRIASYLDASFAMPHLHLGLLLKRLGSMDAAKNELLRAHNLLQSEDAARLLLFGGGFGRSALLAFCDAELRTCGQTA